MLVQTLLALTMHHNTMWYPLLRFHFVFEELGSSFVRLRETNFDNTLFLSFSPHPFDSKCDSCWMVFPTPLKISKGLIHFQFTANADQSITINKPLNISIQMRFGLQLKCGCKVITPIRESCVKVYYKQFTSFVEICSKSSDGPRSWSQV